jgi:hypothetical protein
MNSRILGMRLASTVFGVVCLAQLLRVATQVEVIAGGYRIPLWPSVVAAIIAGSLSVWLWRLSKGEV